MKVIVFLLFFLCSATLWAGTTIKSVVHSQPNAPYKSVVALVFSGDTTSSVLFENELINKLSDKLSVEVQSFRAMHLAETNNTPARVMKALRDANIGSILLIEEVDRKNDKSQFSIPIFGVNTSSWSGTAGGQQVSLQQREVTTDYVPVTYSNTSLTHNLKIIDTSDESVVLTARAITSSTSENGAVKSLVWKIAKELSNTDFFESKPSNKKNKYLRH